jgi:large-conductance mechanosensitive channel
LIKEFKIFAGKDNILDLAVSDIFVGAFGRVVSSLVKGVILPLLLASFYAELFKRFDGYAERSIHIAFR